MKIINILTHTPQEVIQEYDSPINYISQFPETDFLIVKEKINWVGFFKNDWHHKWGSVIKKLRPDFEMECWRPYGNKINNIYQKQVDGLLHKVFPSTSLRIRGITSYETSRWMLSELKNEVQKGPVIIHFYGSNSPIIFWLLNNLKPKGTPVILQHLGWSFSYFEYKYNNKPLKLISWFYQKMALHYVNLYLSASVVENSFLKKKFPKLRVEFFLNGIDFSSIAVISKKEARIKLNIPFDAKVILYVGRYNRTKNVDKVIDVFCSLKKKDDNYILYLVGGYRQDEHYQYAIENGVQVVLRTDNPINQYFAASDVYLMPINEKMHQDFGGFGIAPIEALANNTPVISPNLKHFPGTTEELKEIGVFMNNPDELETKLSEVFINSDKRFSRCREIAENYFEIQKNSIKMIEFYLSLYTQNEKL